MAAKLPQSSAIELALADPSGAEVRECLAQYFSELASRFPQGFEVSADGPPEPKAFTLPSGCMVLARAGGRAVGCGGLRTWAPGIGEIKRMWILPTMRGLGIGRRLLERLELEATRRGMHVVRLDTNAVLEEALRLYRSAGYREIAKFNENPYAHHWFEKKLQI